MRKETLKHKKLRANNIAEALNEIYGKGETELLHWDSPFRLVIAVSLSAQTTDKMVNSITPVLWKKYPDIEDLANAKIEDIENIIRPIGFYKNKARNTKNCATMIINDFNGEVPTSMENLQKLPGVGRKTANIVLNVAFDKVEGIAVDTHVFRISHKLKLSDAKNPKDTEKDLLKVFKKSHWKNLNHQMVLFGRQTCIANRPQCNICKLSKYCPSFKINS